METTRPISMEELKWRASIVDDRSMDIDKLFDRYSAEQKSRFKKFHAENPHIFIEFKRLAKQMLTSGRKKYSARTIFEVMRWDYDIKTKHEEFKISNDFIPIYVRLLIYNHKEFLNFFSLKGLDQP